MGNGTFTEAATPLGLDALHDARGLAAADFDRDGDVDFIVNNYRAPAQYFANNSARGHWLQVRLRGRNSNRDGVGAVLRAKNGTRRQMRVVTAGDGFASQFSRVAHFGLGAEATVEELTVEWPSGKRQTFRNVPADRLLEIDEEGTDVREITRR